MFLISDRWDCLATVFFIDTAHNIIAYIETIYKILKPGGVWVNIGELVWTVICYMYTYMYTNMYNINVPEYDVKL